MEKNQTKKVRICPRKYGKDLARSASHHKSDKESPDLSKKVRKGSSQISLTPQNQTKKVRICSRKSGKDLARSASHHKIRQRKSGSVQESQERIQIRFSPQNRRKNKFVLKYRTCSSCFNPYPPYIRLELISCGALSLRHSRRYIFLVENKVLYISRNCQQKILCVQYSTYNKFKKKIFNDKI